jgi:hypothetical protein
VHCLRLDATRQRRIIGSIHQINQISNYLVKKMMTASTALTLKV